MSDAKWHRGEEVDLYRVLAEMVTDGQHGVLATVIGAQRSTPRHLGSKMIVHADGRVTGSVGGGRAEALVVAEARQVLSDGVCRRLQLDLRGDLAACGGELELFLEPIGNNQPFWVVGAGHIGRAVVRLGAGLAWRFVLVDDRPDFLTDVTGATVLEADPQKLAAHLTITPRTAILIASRSHELDGQYLDAVLAAERKQGVELPYLGVIGSRTKAAKLAGRRGDSPQARERWQRIQMPVGLTVGAETPGEIALSVLAEALAVLRAVPLIHGDNGQMQGVYLHRCCPRTTPADQPEVP